MRTLVADYFYYIHDKPHSLFLLGDLNKASENGTLPRSIIYGIAALSAGFSKDEAIRTRVFEFASAAREALRANLEIVSLENIKACILVGEHAAAVSDRAAEIMYDSWAIRMSQILRLWEDDPAESTAGREIRSRIWYSCCMIDTWASTGHYIPRMIGNHRTVIVDLTPEDKFQQLPNTHIISTGTEVGLWTYMARLALVFSQVPDLHHRLAAHDSDERSIHQKAAEIATKLDKYHAELPASLRFNQENLQSHGLRGIGHVFIALHLGYHYYSTLVHFQYLDTRRSELLPSDMHAERCKYHAATLSDILCTSLSQPGCETLYQSVGHMATVSSCVLLYVLLLGDGHEIDAAKARLETNFTKLMELARYWPGMQQAKDRLLEFQHACFISESQTVHKLDNWMVKFLLHYALPLPPKRSGQFSERFLERIGVTDDVFQKFNV